MSVFILCAKRPSRVPKPRAVLLTRMAPRIQIRDFRRAERQIC
jgi:hypothetical protein